MRSELTYLLTYLLTYFVGHLTADDRNRINVILRKALRRGVTHTAFDIAEIILTNLIVNSSPGSSILVIVYITSSLEKPLHTAVIDSEKDNTPFNYPILNILAFFKTVSSIDVYLNLDDCILRYSTMCFCLNFVHIVR